MILLLLLLGSYLLIVGFQKYIKDFGISKTQTGRIALSVMFIVTAIAHFTSTQKMVSMLPAFIPHRELIIYITGVLEFLGAIGLLIPFTRKVVGPLFIVFLLGLLPSNIYAALERTGMGGSVYGPWYLLFRIPLQFFLIGWIYWASEQTWFSRVVFVWGCEIALSTKDKMKIRKETLAEARGTVVELGMGTGLNLECYPLSIHKVIGVDPNPGMNKKAQNRVKQAPFPVEVHPLKGENIPFKSESADCVVSTWTLCSIPDPVKALKEAYRVLKPTGNFLFVEHGLSPDLYIQKWQKRFNPIQRVLGDGCRLDCNIKDVILSAGFKIKELKEFYNQPDPKTHGYLYQGIAVKQI